MTWKKDLEAKLAPFVAAIDDPRCTPASRACLAPSLILFARVLKLQGQRDRAATHLERAILELGRSRAAGVALSIQTPMPGESWAMSLEAWQIEATAYLVEGMADRDPEAAWARLGELGDGWLDPARVWERVELVAVGNALRVRGELAARIGDPSERATLERAVSVLSAAVLSEGEVDPMALRGEEGGRCLTHALVSLGAAVAAGGDPHRAHRLLAERAERVRALDGG